MRIGVQTVFELVEFEAWLSLQAQSIDAISNLWG